MKKYFFLFPLFAFPLYSQHSGFSFYSGRALFQPLSANTFEPRVGLIWHMNNNRQRLDIGNSVDLIQYRFDNQRRTMTVGSDFFTYTLLRGESNFHFPVDASDYFFGININYKDTLECGIFSSRLRLSHISAHFVDGHFDSNTRKWKDGLDPRVYSREFFDLVFSYDLSKLLRLYIGGMYIWHVDPPNLGKYGIYGGCETHNELFLEMNVYTAYQLSISNLIPRNEIQLGIKIGDWYGRGSKLFYLYHYGNSIHGEYFDRKDVYSGVGFNVDF